MSDADDGRARPGTLRRARFCSAADRRNRESDHGRDQGCSTARWTEHGVSSHMRAGSWHRSPASTRNLRCSRGLGISSSGHRRSMRPVGIRGTDRDSSGSRRPRTPAQPPCRPGLNADRGRSEPQRLSSLSKSSARRIDTFSRPRGLRWIASLKSPGITPGTASSSRVMSPIRRRTKVTSR
jgi:hypothetical protein